MVLGGILLTGCQSKSKIETLNPKDYAGRYKAIDSEVDGNYIKLYENKVSKRSVNNGADFSELTSTFGVTKEEAGSDTSTLTVVMPLPLRSNRT